MHRRRAPGRLFSLALLLAALVAPALPLTATAAPGADAVMRASVATKRADAVLTVDVLSNDDPPPGTAWDRSSVCLSWNGGCVKQIAVDGFTKRVNDDGSITTFQPSRYGGGSGVTYAVQDTAGRTWTSRLAVTEQLVSAPRNGDPDPAVRARLRVTQAVSPTTFDHAGQVLTWTSVVSNVGNVALDRLSVTDASFHVSARTCTPVALAGTLDPGASTTCTGTLTIRQDYLDEHADRNDAVTASGSTSKDGISYQAQATATATSLPVQSPRLELSAYTVPTSEAGLGQPVNYAFTATNRGNLTLRDLLVFAPFPGLGALVCAPVPMGGELAPGEHTICRADRTIPANLYRGTTLVDTAKATARSYTRAYNAVTVINVAVPSGPQTPTPAPGPAPSAKPDRGFAGVGRPTFVPVLDNDSPGSAERPLVGSSVRLRLTPDLPPGSTLWGNAKVLVVPRGEPGSTNPAAGGGTFLVSGKGEITFVPLGFEPAPPITVGYQVADAAGSTTRSTLTVTTTR